MESAPPTVTQSDQRSLPDVEGNRHHGVEKNEVGPECEEGRDKWWWDIFFPRQKILEVVAFLVLPNAMPNC